MGAKTAWKAAAAAALVLGLAACGGGDDSNGSSGQPAGPVGVASIPASALTISGFVEYFNGLVALGTALDREEARLVPAGVAEVDDRGEARLLN